MTGISSINNLGALSSSSELNQFAQTLQATGLNENPALNLAADRANSVEEVKAVFQEFVAGTFYSSMLKSMHAMHDKPAYLHGGQAEEMFQNQLDQEISKELAAEHGDALVAPLLPAFAREVNSSELAKAFEGPGALPRR
ncbi:MAG: rod-binding protein [Planctomycetaceae bacterium]|nr:rod-binding protein [Planctomycetaceae bacterium]